MRQPGIKLLDDDKIYSLAVEAYTQHSFTGLIGFHYHNEPCLQWKRMLDLQDKIRTTVPTARFILWSNGTIIPDDPRIKNIEMVVISDYFNNEKEIKQHFNNTQIIQQNGGVFDKRDENYQEIIAAAPCGRPLVEAIIDAWGRARMCCQDWQGQIDLGNVWENTLTEILTKRNILIPQILKGNLPDACLRCKHRCPNYPFETNIYNKAQEYYG